MEEDIPYGYVERLFRLNNNVSIITTTVEDREDVTDHYISRFLSATSDSENKTKVFGFDIEWKCGILSASAILIRHHTKLLALLCNSVM
ncbi:hypothetical protein L195_g040797, partial [Trifolium pratense]